VAILAPYYLAERIVRAVVWSNLPLGTQVFQAENFYVRASRINVLFRGSQIVNRQPDIVAGVAERARTVL
jgi:hypothetical protein